MGDIADDIIDRFIFGRPRGASLPPPELRCKFCGARHVYWRAMADGSWELRDGDSGKRHACQQDPDKDFGALT